MFRSDSQAFSDVGLVAKDEFGRIRISIWIRTPSLPENPTIGRNIHWEHPAPTAPIGLCFQLGTLECGSLLLQLPHKKHKKKTWKLDRITPPGNLGIQIYQESFIMSFTFLPCFFGRVNMFEGFSQIAWLVCLALLRRCRSRSFRETGNMAVRRRACREVAIRQGPLGTPKNEILGICDRSKIHHFNGEPNRNFKRFRWLVFLSSPSAVPNLGVSFL